MPAEPLIVEWPHSRALGERWVVYPPTIPGDQPWPGIRFFPTRADALVYAQQTFRPPVWYTPTIPANNAQRPSDHPDHPTDPH